jgi:hypothetical protein
MAEPEHFDVLVLGIGQGCKLLTWHIADRATARRSASAGGSEAHAPTSLHATWFDHNIRSQ